MHLLASPRKRRRLAWSLGLVLALAGVVLVAVLFWNTATWTATPVEDTPIRTGAEPVAVPIKMTPEVRREVRQTLDRFVDAAVLRKGLEEAWAMSTPTLRGGVTHREWSRGELPIQPYPWNGIRGVDLRFLYTDTESVAVDVMLMPREQANPILVYTADLTPVGKGEKRRWLVDYWAPQASIGRGGPPPKEEGEQQETTTEAAPQPKGSFKRGRLGPEWFLIPAGILALIVGIPVYLGVKGSIATRRAERRYREELGG